jgi:hypothetical protein
VVGSYHFNAASDPRDEATREEQESLLQFVWELEFVSACTAGQF